MVVFEDLIHGRMSFDSNGISDFIIVRSDGMAAYNFACVIDDHAMQISHVIRGEDHLSNTPRQILVYRTLRWEPPVFAHHPLILGPDRSPLSKRHGATAVSQYREEGFLPETLLNYLVLLGWASPAGEEILPLEKIIETFSLSGLSRNAPTHSRKKLEWLNSHYIRKSDKDRLTRLLLPYFEKAGIPIGTANPENLEKICGLLRENLTVLSQVEHFLGIFFDEKFSFEEEAKAILMLPENRDHLRTILNTLEGGAEIGEDSASPLLRSLEEKTGRKGKPLYGLLRAGMTGKMKGPELVKTLPLIGKERMMKRLKMAMEIA
jgi:nondiscriminating glutamyl-tRNA synthetase